jgi:type IV secretory pathway VirB6-like protein
MVPVNPFSFLAQAITDLLTSNLGLFESMGLSLFRGLAVILLAWFGVKAALSSAQGGPGFNFAKFADLVLLIAFGLAMETYYSTPSPGMGYSFSDLVTREAQFLSNQIESNQADQIANAITTAEEQLGSPPGIFSFHEALTFFAVYIALAIAQGVAFAVIAYGLVATAVCVLLGPIFVPFLIVPKLDWLFWGWFKAFLGFAFYQVVAAAFLFIFAKVLLGLFAVIGPLSISNAYMILPALIVTLAVCVYGLLKIPDLTASILGGRTGSWVNPLGS